jgi:hypothetical protein
VDRRTREALLNVQRLHCEMAHHGLVTRHLDCAECNALYRILRWAQAPRPAPAPLPLQVGSGACGTPGCVS